jgi:uncharacterized protein with von Willebrand factor type A (vWA) domain
MLTHRYTRWDGRQAVRFDADEVFSRLNEYLASTDDLRQALDWLLRQGMEIGGEEVVGLDDLLERLRTRMRERQQEVNLDSALDGKRRAFDELLDLEREALGDGPDAAARRSVLDGLPAGLADAIAAAREHGVRDPLAARELEHLLEDLEDIRALEEFQRKHREVFQGPRPLDYDEALELLRELERLRALEQQMMAGNLAGVNLDDLRRALGDDAADGFERLRRMMQVLHESGYLTQREGQPALSPKGIRKIGQLALRDIFQALKRDRMGGHALHRQGAVTLRPESTKPYVFGEPLHLDLVGTLKQSLTRRRGMPLALAPEDFRVHEADAVTTASTVLLLDMSWSMSWEGRFAAAKKVALAMESLIRSRYPRDYFAIVGFFTRAVELKLRDLPEATWNMGDPFTNLQDGLRLGAELLSRRPDRNRHMIIITDGQPTAYFQQGRLYCEWPLSFGGISMRAAQETLREVERVTRMGIVINTFMLDDSPSLRAFVERMTRVNRGRALYTRPDHLGEYLLVDYVQRKRKRL